MASQNFFSRQPAFGNFLEFEETNHYRPAPSDWFLMISDVQGSTEAIKKGRYKTVNMLGASSIAAIMNVAEMAEVPFIFGGDGATALLPPEMIEASKSALRSVRRHSFDEHKLKLRVGIVPLREIYAKGGRVEVSKFSMGPDARIAFFRGNGVSMAEAWVKAGNFEIEPGPETPIAQVLKGLSCRWDPMPSTQGCVLSIIVKSRSEEASYLAGLSREINAIVDLSSSESNPVKTENLSPASLLEASEIEAGHLGFKFKWVGRLLVIAQMLLLQIFKVVGVRVDGISIRDYLADLTTHSDFHKFDEMLRMILDCNPHQRDKILSLLAREHAAGNIFYGVHEAKSALLTCLVHSLAKGKHIHFVDGSDGGYALAARQLKLQMSEKTLPVNNISLEGRL